ncbi:HNH endonuclease [Burkholderia seminalis]|uniref:HNH endonuclease n=1 Tax=Burkholderia seminalis TaxID=488731 RepID=UPI002650F1E2|nr:HNH endonuclease signature motif containing protein [Burkholderia seminalis]MDN7847856.1 HNH endonuclease signature motif containing protein [Burkholderia seminalis]
MITNSRIKKHKKSINVFMQETLKLHIRNKVWSFDATADDGVVVMKLWQKDRQVLPDGKERIRIWLPVPDHEVKLGRKERLRNIQRMQVGGKTYAIVRGLPDSHDRDPYVYENDRLYELGNIEIEPDGMEYAVVRRVMTIDEFLNRNGKPVSDDIAAIDLSALLASLGARTVVTKNNRPDAEQNYRLRPDHAGDMLDGYWVGQPAGVRPSEAFALHLVERNKEVWLGEYLGTINEGDGRFSLIIGNAQRFHVPDLDFSNSKQQLLRKALKKPGAVTYSYFDPDDWNDAVTNGVRTLDGPAFKMSTVKQRRRQQAFRAAVFARHGATCKITGCNVEELLEAAHLSGFNWQCGDNSADHGIPLRVDIHRAYDRGLLTLDRNHQIDHLDATLEEQYGRFRHR